MNKRKAKKILKKILKANLPENVIIKCTYDGHKINAQKISRLINRYNKDIIENLLLLELN